ncbi:hypothetical protein CYMTET_54134, partial [Cymbomonas tetramitiformis]
REVEVRGHLEGNRREKLQRYAEDGSKARYFMEDDSKTLEAMVREQKHGGERNMDDVMARNIARKQRFKGLNADEEYDNDGGVEMLETHNRRKTRQENEEREKKQAIREYNRFSTIQDRCGLCFNSARWRRDLCISIGTQAYLTLPEFRPLVPGHSRILPMQ